MDAHYDVIVIGVGSMGSATCYQLARAGARVLGLEQFSIPNDKSSHTGQSRIIRKAYFEHADYVPLLQRAYQLWDEIEHVSATKLYYETGLLYLGPPGHPVMDGVRYAAHTYAIPLDVLSNADVKSKFPAITIPSNAQVLFEPQAGFLRPELCIETFAREAVKAGAVIKDHCQVVDWHREGGKYVVRTKEALYTTDKMVITAGPWIDYVLPSWSHDLRMTRQVISWIRPQDPIAYALGNFPCWIVAEEGYDGVFYGFPALPSDQFEGPYGLKLAHHHPGETTAPAALDRKITDDDTGYLLEFANRYFTSLDLKSVESKVCMYTNTTDEHFIIDFVPEYGKDVVVATGFSGHGFKFASVIGEILRELALEGKSSLPIEFLQRKRLASRE